jgi:hypothetical protein
MASPDPSAPPVADPKMRQRMIVFTVLTVGVVAYVAYAVALTGNLELVLIGGVIILLMLALVRLPKPKGNDPQLRQRN